MLSDPSAARKADLMRPPFVLGCSCGSRFSCALSAQCPNGCPWRDQCRNGYTSIGRQPLGTLRARCPRCGAEELYFASGLPVRIIRPTSTVRRRLILSQRGRPFLARTRLPAARSATGARSTLGPRPD